MKEINYGHELGNFYNTKKQFHLGCLTFTKKIFQKEASSDKET